MGVALVLLVDQFLKLQPDRVPGDIFAIFCLRAADEESFERQDPTRRLNPLVVHGAADCGHMHANLVGDLLHLQWLDRFGALVQESFLVLDDRLGHAGQRAAALLDRVDQPLRAVDLSLDELTFLGRAVRDPAVACGSTR